MEKKVAVAIQLYSLRSVITDDVPGTLKQVAGMGYEGVEFAGYYDLAAGELRGLLEESGLRCAGSHVKIDLLEGKAFDDTVAFNKALGNDRLIIPHARFDDLSATVSRIQAVYERSKAAGMKVGYHNHRHEFDVVAGKTVLDHLLERLPEDFLAQIDIGWACAAGEDLAALVRRHADRIDTVHVKEFHPDRPDAVVGEGKVDWPSLMDIVERETRVQWYIVEQEDYEVGPIESARACIENLRRMGRGRRVASNGS